MADLLIRDIGPDLKRQIEDAARRHQRSLSEEAKLLIRKGLGAADPELKMGDWLYGLVRPEDRGDDLVFEYKDDFLKPPDFE